MGSSQGAPWWLTIFLPIVTAAITHYLTLNRERQKTGRDWHQKWLDDSKKLISKVSDSAVQHYVDNSSLAKTSVSASLIISDIKRIGGLLRESTCLNATDSKSTFDALRDFNNAITSPDDFQDSQREIRGPDDILLARIRECEHVLIGFLNKPRKRKE
jgi:hypothetical protein